MTGPVFLHPPLTCPLCGYRPDASSPVVQVGYTPPAPPADGDVSLCFECAATNVYTAGATRLRSPTRAERIGLDRDPLVQAAARRIRRRPRRPTIQGPA